MADENNIIQKNVKLRGCFEDNNVLDFTTEINLKTSWANVDDKPAAFNPEPHNHQDDDLLVNLINFSKIDKTHLKENNQRLLSTYSCPQSENENDVLVKGQNLFIGYQAGNETMGKTATTTTQASRNVGIGYKSLFNNTLGYYNTALGVASLHSNTTGYSNTAMGYHSLYSNTTGYSNTAMGYQSLCSNTTGYSNAAIGSASLINKILGSNNTALGFRSGRYIADGSNLTDINNSVFIGYDTRPPANGGTNEIVIGYTAIGKGSNTSIIGNNNITDVYLSSKNFPVYTGTENTTWKKLATEDWVEGKNYLTTHQSLTDYATIGYVDNTFIKQLDLSNIPKLSLDNVFSGTRNTFNDILIKKDKSLIFASGNAVDTRAWTLQSGTPAEDQSLVYWVDNCSANAFTWLNNNYTPTDYAVGYIIKVVKHINGTIDTCPPEYFKITGNVGGQYESKLLLDTITQNRTWKLPDSSGTLATKDYVDTAVGNGGGSSGNYYSKVNGVEISQNKIELGTYGLGGTLEFVGASSMRFLGYSTSEGSNYQPITLTQPYNQNTLGNNKILYLPYESGTLATQTYVDNKSYSVYSDYASPRGQNEDGIEKKENVKFYEIHTELPTGVTKTIFISSELFESGAFDNDVYYDFILIRNDSFNGKNSIVFSGNDLNIYVFQHCWA